MAATSSIKTFADISNDFEKVAHQLQNLKFDEEIYLKTIADQWFESQEGKNEVEREINQLFSQDRLDACLGMMAEIENVGSNTEAAEGHNIFTTDAFLTFKNIIPNVPTKLLSSSHDITNFKAYVKSMCYKASLDMITKNVIKKFRRTFEDKNSVEKMTMFNSSLFYTKQEIVIEKLCNEYKESLASSDHEKIGIEVNLFKQQEVSLISGDGINETKSNYHIASHNVQERKKNGISTFVSSMRFLNEMSQHKTYVRESLIALMLREEVNIEHYEQILNFVKNELQINNHHSNCSMKKCIAVCLQEVSYYVVFKLRESLCQSSNNYNGNGVKVYSSAPTTQESMSSSNNCEAITCIITNNHFPTVQLEDLIVNYKQPNKIVTRHFAMVYFINLDIILVSIHIRHAPQTLSKKTKPVNERNKKKSGNQATVVDDAINSIGESDIELDYPLVEMAMESILNEDNVNVTLMAVADRFHQLQNIHKKDNPKDLNGIYKQESHEKIENITHDNEIPKVNETMEISSQESVSVSGNSVLNSYHNFKALKGIIVTGDFNANIDEWNNRIVSTSNCVSDCDQQYHISTQVPPVLTAHGGQSLRAIDGVLWMQPLTNNETFVDLKAHIL